MNKKKLLLILPIMFIIIIGSFFVFNRKKEIVISDVLKQEEYNYLPDEAKEYVKDVYEETKEVVRTVKNKKKNKSYLNPDYVKYLKLSASEKNNVDLIPDAYVLDYEISKSYSNSVLPTSYDLRNVEEKKLCFTN